ncbi:DUF3862 domain-containing protein [Aneurinibacillus aneurinilyticus]|uniref:DUF3862 domain-containing protein n=1 Tax=Aneurinibacillus aneurinilyticus TaxID=1391 RepID=UPI002E1A2D7E|nr:DUF3862 domain-containing protein [Aneurinibacillus aneurinilyticus]
MGYLIRKNWWIIGLILLLVIILIVAEKQQKEEKAYFKTLEASQTETSKITSYDLTQAENEYTKTAVYELLNISRKISVLSKYNFNDTPKDTAAFETWRESIGLDLREIQSDVSNNLISERYTELFSTPEKFKNVNTQALNLLSEMYQDTKDLYTAINNHKVSDIPNLAKKLQAKEDNLKKLSNEIVTIADYPSMGQTEQSITQSSIESKLTINKVKFDSIENGMSQEEVEKIIGGPGELVSEIGNKGEPLHTVMYAYKGEGDLKANANFLFQGNKLQNKAQIGLK